MVETLDDILRKALEYHGSDVFVVPGSHIMTKSHGKMIPISEEKACRMILLCWWEGHTSWHGGNRIRSSTRAMMTFHSPYAT